MLLLHFVQHAIDQKPDQRQRARRRRRVAWLISVTAWMVVSSGVVLPSATAAPGDLIFAGCIGDLAGCTATNPTTALDNANDVVVDGLQVYATSGAEISHFTIDAAGNLAFGDCIGNEPGCTGANLLGADALAVTTDGKQLYTTVAFGGSVSHFTIDSAGNLIFAGCIGHVSGCTQTSPLTALAGADGIAVTADGRQLYVTSFFCNAVSHFNIDAAGNPIFAGCIGDQAGYTATSPAGVLDGAEGMAVTADGQQLYAASGGSISHFNIDAAGNLIFAGCIGAEPGCTAVSPAGTLGLANSLVVTADGKQLYATANVGAVSHFTIDAAGNLAFAGCIGDFVGCTPTSPAGALDDAHGVAVSGDGAHLYATASSNGGHAVSHFRIDAAGNLIFAGCIGDRSGCTATTPAGALDGAQGVAESADGANLYVTSSLANTVSHFIIAGFTAR